MYATIAPSTVPISFNAGMGTGTSTARLSGIFGGAMITVMGGGGLPSPFATALVGRLWWLVIGRVVFLPHAGMGDDDDDMIMMMSVMAG